MKKSISVFLCLLLLATSCSHRVYNAKALNGNYDMQMTSKKDLEIKGKVRIFLSENDVNDEFEVISFNTYKPFTIPIFMSQHKRTMIKFYEKAVKKAYEQGGNGIIIVSGGIYKVIYLKNWDSDNADAGLYYNSVLDTTLMNKFKSGEISTLTPREIKRYVSDFFTEITFNSKTAKTYEELVILGDKIKALSEWNSAQESQDSRLGKKLMGYEMLQKQRLNRVMRKNGIKVETACDEVSVAQEGNYEVNEDWEKYCGTTITHDGITASIIKIEENKAIIAIARYANGTWYDAKEYCDKLGDGWKLPQRDLIRYIRKNSSIMFSKCWTDMEVNETVAKAWFQGYVNPIVTTNKSTQDISIIAVKYIDINDISANNIHSQNNISEMEKGVE